MARFETVEGLTIHYRDEGTARGIACIAFINSLGTDLRIWDEVLPHLKPEFRVVRHDKRGHGLSDCLPGPYAMSDHARDLAGLLERLDTGPVILVGISVGGMIALSFAIAYPEAVEAMILCDTGARIGSSAYWTERIESVQNSGMEIMAEKILERWFAPEFVRAHPAEYQGYRNMLLRTPVDGYTGTCAALGEADFRETIGTILTRTLVLTGSEDLASPPDLGRELADGLANAEFGLIERAGHLSCIEQPAQLADRINRFIAR